MKKYYKEKGSFFDYFINISTGKKKYFLEEGEIEVEKPKFDEDSNPYATAIN